MAAFPTNPDDDNDFSVVFSPGAGTRPLTEDEVVRLLTAGASAAPPRAAPWAERFDVLSKRRGRPMSEQQIMAVLAGRDEDGNPHAGDGSSAESCGPRDLPTAQVSPVPFRPPPAPLLDYSAKPSRLTRRRRAAEATLSIQELPLPFRIIRVAVWLLVAALMVLVIILGAPRGV
jgi:hypothetical protein